MQLTHLEPRSTEINRISPHLHLLTAGPSENSGASEMPPPPSPVSLSPPSPPPERESEQPPVQPSEARTPLKKRVRVANIQAKRTGFWMWKNSVDYKPWALATVAGLAGIVLAILLLIQTFSGSSPSKTGTDSNANSLTGAASANHSTFGSHINATLALLSDNPFGEEPENPFGGEPKPVPVSPVGQQTEPLTPVAEPPQAATPPIPAPTGGAIPSPFGPQPEPEPAATPEPTPQPTEEITPSPTGGAIPSPFDRRPAPQPEPSPFLQPEPSPFQQPEPVAPSGQREPEPIPKKTPTPEPVPQRTPLPEIESSPSPFSRKEELEPGESLTPPVANDPPIGIGPQEEPLDLDPNALPPLEADPEPVERPLLPPGQDDPPLEEKFGGFEEKLEPPRPVTDGSPFAEPVENLSPPLAPEPREEPFPTPAENEPGSPFEREPLPPLEPVPSETEPLPPLEPLPNETEPLPRNPFPNEEPLPPREPLPPVEPVGNPFPLEEPEQKIRPVEGQSPFEEPQKTAPRQPSTIPPEGLFPNEESPFADDPKREYQPLPPIEDLPEDNSQENPFPEKKNEFEPLPPVEPLPENNSEFEPLPPVEPLPENNSEFEPLPPVEPLPENKDEFEPLPPVEPLPEKNEFEPLPPVEPLPEKKDEFEPLPPIEPLPENKGEFEPLPPVEDPPINEPNEFEQPEEKPVPIPMPAKTAELDVEFQHLAPPTGFDAAEYQLDADEVFQVFADNNVFGPDGTGYVLVTPRRETGLDDDWSRADLRGLVTRTPPLMRETTERIPMRADIAFRTFIDAPRLAYTLEAPQTVQIGKTVRLRFHVTNIGNIPATKAIFRIDLPEEFQHRYGRELDYKIGNLAPGETHEAFLTVEAVRPGLAQHHTEVVCDEGARDTVLKSIRVLPGTGTVQPASFSREIPHRTPVVQPMPPRMEVRPAVYIPWPQCRCGW